MARPLRGGVGGGGKGLTTKKKNFFEFLIKNKQKFGTKLGGLRPHWPGL